MAYYLTNTHFEGLCAANPKAKPVLLKEDNYHYLIKVTR